MNIENNRKEYKSDKTIVYSCQFHVIFCTKYRRKVLDNKVDVRLKELIFDNQMKHDYQIHELEIMPDHVHLLIDVNPKIGIHKTIKKIKGLSSNILRNEFSFLKSRIPSLWTRSYFVSTVGSVSLETVKRYIENQKSV